MFCCVCMCFTCVCVHAHIINKKLPQFSVLIKNVNKQLNILHAISMQQHTSKMEEMCLDLIWIFAYAMKHILLRKVSVHIYHSLDEADMDFFTLIHFSCWSNVEITMAYYKKPNKNNFVLGKQSKKIYLFHLFVCCLSVRIPRSARCMFFLIKLILAICLLSQSAGIIWNVP